MTSDASEPRPWFYAREGETFGPVEESALRELAARGEIHPTDLLWRGGMSAWEPAGRTAGLFPEGHVPPPLPVSYNTPRFEPSRPLEESAGMRMLLPVGRSGWAIAAGYLGLFSVLGCVAPLAIICAIIAFRDMQNHPDRHGMGRAVFGLIMGMLGTLGLIVVIISAASRS